MKNLLLSEISQHDHLVYPDEFHDMTLESPALRAMTNFRQERPQIIDANISASEAKVMITKTHASLFLVANENMELVGLVTAKNLSERRMVRLVADGSKRSEILVSDLMISRRYLRALDYTTVCNSKVKDVIAVLSSSGQSQCLVVDSVYHYICGLFSIDDISNRLEIPVDLNHQLSFSQLVEAITH